MSTKIFSSVEFGPDLAIHVLGTSSDNVVGDLCLFDDLLFMAAVSSVIVLAAMASSRSWRRLLCLTVHPTWAVLTTSLGSASSKRVMRKLLCSGFVILALIRRLLKRIKKSGTVSLQ